MDCECKGVLGWTVECKGVLGWTVDVRVCCKSVLGWTGCKGARVDWM